MLKDSCHLVAMTATRFSKEGGVVSREMTVLVEVDCVLRVAFGVTNVFTRSDLCRVRFTPDFSNEFRDEFRGRKRPQNVAPIYRCLL